MTGTLDYRSLFERLPTPYLVLSPDLVVVTANAAYLAAVGRDHDDLVGRPVFEAFPPTGDAMDPSGVPRIQLSFERARDTGQPDTMPVQRYDLVDPGTGSVREAYWSLIHIPMLDPGTGRTVNILQRAEDVTDYVQERELSRVQTEHGLALRRRHEETAADLFARSQELQAALRTRDELAGRLAVLAEVAMELGGAETSEELSAVVVARGAAALGGRAGTLAVKSLDGLRLVVDGAPSGGAEPSVLLEEASPLPAARAASTGQRVLLGDLQACTRFDPGMAEVARESGCQAWAALPLRSSGTVIGAMVIGWAEPQQFAREDLEMMEALAAQCAQGLERIQVREAERTTAEALVRMSETLQRSLLTDPPQPDHLQIAVRYVPAAREAQIGGDWYDAFMTRDGVTNLVIGDVAGHDRIAAAVMGQLRNLLRGVAYSVAEPPGHVLSALDRALRDLAVGSLATGILARLEQDPELDGTGERVFRWSNAGHPPPLLIRADGTAQLLSRSPDLLLGLDPDTERSDHSCPIHAGDSVVLFTDGLIERRGESLDRGLARLVERAAALSGLTLEDLVDALLHEAGRQDDDIALIALRAHRQDLPRPREAGPQVLPQDIAARRLAGSEAR